MRPESFLAAPGGRRPAPQSNPPAFRTVWRLGARGSIFVPAALGAARVAAFRARARVPAVR